MPLPAIFGIDNDGVNLAINLLILFLVVVYLALIAWTYLDAKRRLEDPVLIGCATVASLFPFLGTIVYTILRPPEFVEDKRERELEIRASQLRVRQLEDASCPNCEHPVDRGYLRCPNCRARIKDPCESCGKPIDPRWVICPYCETPTKAAKASPQRRASSRPPSEGASSRTGSSRAASRPSRAKRPVSRTSEQRAAKERSKSKAPVRRSTTKKPSRRTEPGDGTAPAS
jgi:hypothetical protein